MRSLVTGASGFLGLYIVEQLVARGAQVRAYCRTTPPELERLRVEIVRGDIRDRDRVVAACAGVETVYLVAGIAGVSGPWREFYEINTLGTEHVIAGCRQHGVGRLVFT